jgi:hypothetical protein
MTALMVSMSKPFMMTPTVYGPAAYVAPSWFSTKIGEPCSNSGSRESFDNLAGAGDKTKAELDVPEQPRIVLFAGPTWLERLTPAFRALLLAQNSPGLAVADLGPIG